MLVNLSSKLVDNYWDEMNVSNQLVNEDEVNVSSKQVDDYWDEHVGFWLEGCLVPMVAAFGIAGTL